MVCSNNLTEEQFELYKSNLDTVNGVFYEEKQGEGLFYLSQEHKIPLIDVKRIDRGLVVSVCENDDEAEFVTALKKRFIDISEEIK